MVALIHLDTHVLVWLYQGRLDLFPPAARDRLEEHDLAVSPMAVLELQYLHEIGRLVPMADAVVEELGRTVGLATCDRPFPAVARRALTLRWTRDPFDRLIVAQATVAGVPLLTRDEVIRRHLPEAIWG